MGADIGFAEKDQQLAISIATSGDNVIITAPSTSANGSYIAIDFLQIFVPVAVGVVLKNGTTAINGIYSFQAGQNVTIENSPRIQDGIITIDPGNNFVINLDASQQCSGIVRYRIMNL